MQNSYKQLYNSVLDILVFISYNEKLYEPNISPKTIIWSNIEYKTCRLDESHRLFHWDSYIIIHYLIKSDAEICVARCKGHVDVVIIMDHSILIWVVGFLIYFNGYYVCNIMYLVMHRTPKGTIIWNYSGF